jgi:hypothetical protein
VTASSHSIPSKAVQNTYLVRSCRSRVHNKLHTTCSGSSLSRCYSQEPRPSPEPHLLNGCISLSLSLSLSPSLSVSLLSLTLLSFHDGILPFLWQRSVVKWRKAKRSPDIESMNNTYT